MHEAAKVYLAHLGKAAQKMSQRDFARKKLELELAALRRLSTPVLHKQLARLEHSIKETIKSEKRILTRQDVEEQTHAKLEKCIRAVGNSLNNYLKLASCRNSSVHGLERTLAGAVSRRQEALEEIKNSVDKLEKLYRSELEAVKAHRHRQILQRIKQKLKKFS